MLNKAGEEDGTEVTGLGKRGLFALTVKDDELVTERRILSNGVGFTVCQVGDRTEHNRMAGRLGEA